MPSRFRTTAARLSFSRRFTAILLSLSIGAAGVAVAAPAHAEGEIRVAEQFGI
ncbi:MAG TPA: ABC transporter substrate-binding protein, partial [Paraburkholderia sp.]